MAKLNDLQFAGLIDEIASAMRMGTPVEASMRRLQSRRLGRVGRAAGLIAGELEAGKSLEQAVQVVSSPIVAQVSAAISAAERVPHQIDAGGAQSHIGGQQLLSRLAVQLRRRNEFIGNTRIAYFYPILLAAIAYAATVLVAAPLVRENQGRDFQWSPRLITTLGWLEHHVWWPPIIALILGLGVWIYLRAKNPLPRHSRLSLFFTTLADQIAANVPEEQAIASAANLSGESQLRRIKNPTLDTPIIARMIGKSSELTDIEAPEFELASDRSTTTSAKPVQRQPSILAARLYYLGAHHAELARRTAYFWSRLVPRFAMIFVGCGFVFAYAWWVIAPVYRQVAQW